MFKMSPLINIVHIFSLLKRTCAMRQGFQPLADYGTKDKSRSPFQPLADDRTGDQSRPLLLQSKKLMRNSRRSSWMREKRKSSERLRNAKSEVMSNMNKVIFKKHLLSTIALLTSNITIPKSGKN